MKDYKDFEKAGMVSVWVGDCADPSCLDDYLNLSQDFERDFGFRLNDRNMPETVTEEAPTTIADLVDGFSWADRFKDSVVEAAKRQGVAMANTMVVFFNCHYDPSAVTVGRSSHLRFLCAVPF